MKFKLMPITVVMIFAVMPCWLLAAAASSEHSDPITNVALALAIVLLAAKVGGEVVTRLGQPSVLGELLIGLILGNLPLVGYSGFEFIQNDPSIDILARLGVLLLLFQVGLESTVGQMMKVGASSLAVAVVGIILPFFFGWGIGVLLLPSESVYVALFLGATLTATSVGITARVLKDLKRSQSLEARIILGAAVIDDVLGLVILAVVTGIISAVASGATISVLAISMILVKALVFLVGSLVLGIWLSPKLFFGASRLRTQGVLLAAGLSFCFILSWLAGIIGLAPIVGAFAAGLILEDFHYRDFVDRGEHTLEELIHPISFFLVPVFFVLMGMRTDISAFADSSVLTLAAALTVAAILGKQACSLGVLTKGVDKISVGIGMIPRGEVGLIFANIGLTMTIGDQQVISTEIFSAVVAMVIFTTLVTPPALKWSLTRSAKHA